MMRLLGIIALLGILSILVIAPLCLSSYYIELLILVFIFGMLAMSLDILLGYTGLPSLGHAASYGVAGYVAGYLSLRPFVNFWLEAAAGLLFAIIVAAVFGTLVLRTRGVYFLMITLALSQVLWGIAHKWTSVTRGDDGLSGIPRPDLVVVELNLADPTTYYYFTLVVFLVIAVAMYIIVHSPFGLIIRGIRDSESRMSALGYNVWRYQYAAFVIACFFAAVSGILAAYYHGFVGPSYLHLVTSAKVMLMVVLGGAGTLFGPLMGAAIIVFLENIISSYTERWLLVLGLIYILVILFAPNGIYDPVREGVGRWLKARARQWTMAAQ